MDLMEVADPDAVHAVRTFIRKELALQLKEEFLSTVGHFMILQRNYCFWAITEIILGAYQSKSSR